MLPNVITFYAGHQSNLAILTDRMVVGGGGGAQLGKLKLAAICKLMLEQLKIVSVVLLQIISIKVLCTMHTIYN